VFVRAANQASFALAALLAVASCASTPRPFAAEIRPPPADRAAYEQAFASCAGQVAQGRRQDFRSDSIEPGSAIGVGTVGIGAAAISNGVSSGGFGGAGFALAGAGVIVMAPLAMWAAWSSARAVREREIQQAMSACLGQNGYVIERWHALNQSEIAAGALATPTAPRDGDHSNNDRQLYLATPALEQGALAHAAPMTLDIMPVEDVRPDATRIGDLRDAMSYRVVTGSVTSTPSPAVLIKQTIESVLAANGLHSGGGGTDRLALRTALRAFRFDYRQVSLITLEFVGNVEADVTLVDRTSGQALYTESFRGTYSETVGVIGHTGPWTSGGRMTRIMNGALVSFAESVNSSVGLEGALSSTALTH
jgi:hypothetical protein